VAGVGAVAVYAESQGTWGSYFRMEQAIAFATPLSMWLLGAAVALSFGAAIVARG
jgi:hypothetical protein